MLLHIKGLELPKGFAIVKRFKPEDLDADNPWYEECVQPKWLLPLKNVSWPKDVIESIAESFKAIGIPSPMEQKLIEPFARAFGGIWDGSGQYKLEHVDWEFVKAYFAWEAACWTLDSAKAKSLQDQASERFHRGFSHHAIYDDPSGSYFE